MFRILIVLLLILQSNCTVNKPYGKEYILEIKKNKNGVTIFKKIKQFFITESGEKYHVITNKEFDSLGRIIKEYGFNNSGRGQKGVYQVDPNAKYLTEYFYKGSHWLLKTTYVWPSNSDSIFIPRPYFLVLQNFRPDTIQPI